MFDLLTCLIVLVLCSAAMGIVAVVSCAFAFFVQGVIDRLMDRRWKK